jgi:uncharacterized protein (DUF1330 family)
MISEIGISLLLRMEKIHQTLHTFRGEDLAGQCGSIHPLRGNIREVNSIVFKISSLDRAKTYLESKDLLGKVSGDKIEMETSKTFRLKIFFSEE